MYETPIVTEAKVLRVIKSDLVEVELPNGKASFGHFSKELRKQSPEIEVGDRVTLELTPFDFDSARISKIL